MESEIIPRDADAQEDSVSSREVRVNHAGIFFIADAALAENRNPSVAEGDFELGRG